MSSVRRSRRGLDDSNSRLEEEPELLDRFGFEGLVSSLQRAKVRNGFVKQSEWATSLDGVAEGVHGDHDASLTRLGGAHKVDGARVLGLEIVEARVGVGLIVEAGFDVRRLSRTSPGDHRHLLVRRALGAYTSAVDRS